MLAKFSSLIAGPFLLRLQKELTFSWAKKSQEGCHHHRHPIRQSGGLTEGRADAVSALILLHLDSGQQQTEGFC